MSFLDDLRAAIARVEATKPIQYYATTDALTLGKALHIAFDGYWPDLWIFHPADFAANRAELARYCRLVDFRTWQPSAEQIDRLWERAIEAAADDQMRQWIEALRLELRPRD